jgi:predicted ATP-grasp superfamily ATP-dependent carboligase
MNHNNIFPPAIVTPLDYHMGIDIARSLGNYGIEVFGVDCYSDSSIPGIHSKYVKFLEAPSPENNDGKDYINFLVNFGRLGTKRKVLFPLSDSHVQLISKHREDLEKYYQFVLSGYEILKKIASKDGLYSIASEFGIPAPTTIFINHGEDIHHLSRDISYPAILKPTRSEIWQKSEIKDLLKSGITSGQAKVLKCNNPEEIIHAYEQIAPIDDRLIIQEVIPGEDSRLVYFAFYMNRKSIPLGFFAGRKVRVIPIGFGSASYVHSYYDNDLIDTGLRLLDAIRYQGLGGIEFKLDPRDGQYKLIEFNTRFGMWDGLGERCGVDLAYIAYRDALELDVEPLTSYQQGMKWIDFQRDLRSAIANIKQGKLSIMDWLHSLRGDKMWAIYSWEDWKPGYFFTIVLIKTLLKRLFAW